MVYLSGSIFTILMYILCIVIPILVWIIEKKKKNVSEAIRVSRARICLFLGMDKKAKTILEDLTEKYNKSFYGHKLLARIYEKEGGMRKAIDEYVKVLDIEKHDYESYYRISVLLNDLNKKEEAAETLRILLKSRPQTIKATSLLGTIYIEQGEFKKAIEVFTNALRYDDEDPNMYYQLGICYTRINDFNAAKKSFQKAVNLDKDMYLAFYRLAQIALLYREYDVAEENFKRRKRKGKDIYRKSNKN